MTNEEKAEKIADKYYKTFDDCTLATGVEKGAIEMAEWKDEQHAQEKQEWIEKVTIFLNERVCTEMSIPEIHNMIVDFRKKMEEQL